MRIDSTKLRREIARDGRSVNAIERDIGMTRGALRHVFRRGYCSLHTFDSLCSALGLNGYEVEAWEERAAGMR